MSGWIILNCWQDKLQLLAGWFSEQSEEHLPPPPPPARRPRCWGVSESSTNYGRRRKKLCFNSTEGGNSGAHGHHVQLSTPVAGQIHPSNSQILPQIALLNCQECM